MILWLDGAHDAPENMARDGHLLERARADRAAEPVLRLFTFAPAGITLGRGQRPDHELDLELCARDDVRWSIRPTGGRAIYHDEEWTFSLASPLGEGGWAERPREAYRKTASLVETSLRDLGVPAERWAGDAAGDARPRRSGPAAPCFDHAQRDELAVEGRKLAGIAQRVCDRTLLQQGSVLLGDSHRRLARYVRTGSGERAALEASLARSTQGAGAWLGTDRSLDRWAAALLARLPGARLVRGPGALGA